MPRSKIASLKLLTQLAGPTLPVRKLGGRGSGQPSLLSTYQGAPGLDSALYIRGQADTTVYDR